MRLYGSGLICFLLFLSNILSAQSQIVVDFDEAPLSLVLQKIEREYELIFSYTEDLVEEKFVTVRFKNLTVKGALEELFKQTEISFEIVDEVYVILREKEIANIRLCGKVQDEYGKPLAFANLYFKSDRNGISTNESGDFDWSGQLLSDSIEISYVGYQPLLFSIEALKTCPSITLKVAESKVAEVIIKEYVTSGIEQSKSLDHIILRPKQIDVVPGLTEADVMQMIQILPGIHSPDESSTGIHIRGNTPDQNLILWDGIPVYNSGHFFGMLSAFNPFIVDNVKVYRAAFGSEYGGRVGGVIDITSENRIPEKTNANIGLNLTHADAAIAIPFWKQRSALILSSRRSLTDVFSSPTFTSLSNRLFQEGKINEQQDEEDLLDLDINFFFNDLNAKWLLKPNEKDHISVSAFGIFDKLEFNSYINEEEIVEFDKLDLKNTGYSLQWHRNWNPKYSSSAKLSYAKLNNQSTYTTGFVDDDIREEEIQKNTVNDVTLHLKNDWVPNPNTKINFGYQFSDLKVSRIFKWSDSDLFETFSDQVSVHSLFATYEENIRDKWKIKIGTRYNTGSDIQWNSWWEPRFSLAFVPKPEWQIRFSAGNYHQIIHQVIELNDLGFNEQFWVLSTNEDELPKVKNQNVNIGLLFNRAGFQFEVEAYLKKLDGLTSVSSAFVNSEDSWDYDVGSGHVRGVDVLLKKQWGKYETWMSYTFSDVKYIFEELNEGRRFSAPHEKPHAFTSTHVLSLPKWQVSMSWNFSSGKVFTAAETEFDGEGIFPTYPIDKVNADRLPNYHRLDASILYFIKPKNKRSEGKIGLSILNLYNQQNYLSRQYDVAWNDDLETEELIYFERVLLGFTPNLVIRWKW